jgi:two-component system cell cycle response regulator
MDIARVMQMNKKVPYENILLLSKEDLIKLVLEYRAKHQDYKIQNNLFKELIKSYSVLSNELRVNVERVTTLSVTDPLTQIYNRLKFNDELDKIINDYKKNKHPFSIIMFDIDHFKNVNDTYGHDTGDLVLTTLCHIVQDNIREIDVFARWGGEEFMILTPNDGIENSKNMAEKLRKVIEIYYFEKVKSITCSFGVTEFTDEDTNDTFTKRVDGALYTAKNQGRNMVKIF